MLYQPSPNSPVLARAADFLPTFGPMPPLLLIHDIANGRSTTPEVSPSHTPSCSPPPSPPSLPSSLLAFSIPQEPETRKRKYENEENEETEDEWQSEIHWKRRRRSTSPISDVSKLNRWDPRWRARRQVVKRRVTHDTVVELLLAKFPIVILSYCNSFLLQFLPLSIPSY